jgi:transposase
VTLQLLWQEYRQAQPEGYGYSRFCELYQRWAGTLDPVLRQVYVPALSVRDLCSSGFIGG